MEMVSKAMPGSVPVPSLGLFNKQGIQIFVAKWSPPIIVFKHTREKSKKATETSPSYNSDSRL